MTGISFRVHGIPAPQGSKNSSAIKRNGVYAGKVAVFESSAKVKPWREAVKAAAVEVKGDDWEPLLGSVRLVAHFYFPRPKSHYGTGRNAGKLKATAPNHPVGPPDLSKLVRSTEDALTEAGIWRDDSLVASIDVIKWYANHGFIGAEITVTPFPDRKES